MMLDFSAGELAQLCELISGAANDIIFKADSDGFITQASQGIALLRPQSGQTATPLLIPPRLQDLVAEPHLHAVEAELALAAGGNSERAWIEFRIGTGVHDGRWYAMRLVPMRDGAGRGSVLGILRDVHERRMLEDRLFAARMTDPLTGLTNRIAFDAMLTHVTDRGFAGSLALFGIDLFGAINHRLGHGFGDSLLAGFAEVLRNVMRTGDTLSRIGGSRFAVLLLETGDDAAIRLCRSAQGVFADHLRAGHVTMPLSASVGIAAIGTCPHDTLRRAERALAMGKAGGSGGQVVRDRPRRAQLAAPPSRAPGMNFRRAG
ncbi:sensor domain-containing diguanylate cyclase [Parerythrobacter aurantius]|uniref:sensor domain-containing diguanylate cyclase n=1 Tax=Parerythrobacter aurantius TaxID=3127706 RepID=UPI00324D8370